MVRAFAEAGNAMRAYFWSMMNWNFFTDDPEKCMHPFGAAHQGGTVLTGALPLAQFWVAVASSTMSKLEQTACANVQHASEHGRLNDRWIPSSNAIEAISQLDRGENLYHKNTPLFEWIGSDSSDTSRRQTMANADLLQSPQELFSRCGEWIPAQANHVKNMWGANDATNIELPNHVQVIGPLENLIMAMGVQVNACTINTEAGPVLLGPESEIQEGSNIRGPLFLGANSIIKMGSRVYGPTTIGAQCRIGGEVSNSTFLGFSNKGHDGFIGNSVIGHWCNLGADTNTSNLKSNYSSVRLWSEKEQMYVDSGLQFCGLIMGDHSKSGINTMFNTGTIVGPGCSIFGSGFQPKHIPSFSWGGGQKWQLHDFDKFIHTARAVMERRGIILTEADIECWREQHQIATERRQ